MNFIFVNKILDTNITAPVCSVHYRDVELQLTFSIMEFSMGYFELKVDQ